jgi:hypothetical protein
MYIQRGNTTEIVPPVGYCFLTANKDATAINGSILIEKNKDYPAQDKRLKKALNTGFIDSLVYNAIKNNRGQENALYLLSTGIEINKQDLVDIVKNKSIENVDTKLTAAQMLKQINGAGYVIIKKI